MELLLIILAICFVGALFVRRQQAEARKSLLSPAPTKELKLEEVSSPSAPFNAQTAAPVLEKRVLKGAAWVVDGDTIVIQKTQIRLYGVDAPEMDHPFGKKAKWALVKLCKGQEIRAEITGADDHGRTVAKCFLPDDRDLSAEMVKQGLAIDWSKYSGGEYLSLETAGVRKKLWLADARQKGWMHLWEKYETQQKRKTSDH